MTGELTILVGTMTGTAELAAEEVRDVLGEHGWSAEIVMMEHADAGIFQAGRLYLICTSTYGQGDVPDNAQDLYEELAEDRPNLAGVRYGMIGLGDSTYDDTFAFGGKKFDDAMQECGATRIGAPMIHDASSGTLAEEDAAEWAKDWVALLGEQLEAA